MVAVSGEVLGDPLLPVAVDIHLPFAACAEMLLGGVFRGWWIAASSPEFDPGLTRTAVPGSSSQGLRRAVRYSVVSGARRVRGTAA